MQQIRLKKIIDKEDYESLFVIKTCLYILATVFHRCRPNWTFCYESYGVGHIVIRNKILSTFIDVPSLKVKTCSNQIPCTTNDKVTVLLSGRIKIFDGLNISNLDPVFLQRRIWIRWLWDRTRNNRERHFQSLLTWRSNPQCGYRSPGRCRIRAWKQTNISVFFLYCFLLDYSILSDQIMQFVVPWLMYSQN